MPPPSPDTEGIPLQRRQTLPGQSVGYTGSALALMKRSVTPISLSASEVAGQGALFAAPYVIGSTIQGGVKGGVRGAAQGFARSAADAAYGIAGSTAGAVGGGAVLGPLGAAAGGAAGGALGVEAGRGFERAVKKAFTRKGKAKRKMEGGPPKQIAPPPDHGGESGIDFEGHPPGEIPEPAPSTGMMPQPVFGGTGPGPQQPFVSQIFQGNQSWQEDTPPAGVPLVAKPRRGNVRIAALAPLARPNRGAGKYGINPISGMPFMGNTKRAAMALRLPPPTRSAQLVF